MSFEFITKLPSPGEIREQYPLPLELAEIKKKKDQEVSDIFTGKSDRFLLIIGPCSADNEDSVCDYANRLAKVQEKVADKIMIIPGYIPINLVLQEKAIKECFTSRTLPRSLTC